MFDLTKEIKLEGNWQKKYKMLKFFVYFLFITGIFYLTFRILFAPQIFDYFFDTPQSLKNTVINMRSENNLPIIQGNMKNGTTTSFDAPFRSITGNYSTAVITLWLEKNSPDIENAKSVIRRSYQAFFYPLGPAMGFREGDLISLSSKYFIISGNKLRQFSSPKILSALGYNPIMFREVDEAELTYNEKGEGVNDAKNYPDGSLFKISEEYYQLREQKLEKFVSANAFLSEYAATSALEKDQEFLNSNILSENLIGFRNGSLLSFGPSVFIASGNLVYPIDSAKTFLSMGYDWSDVIPASEEELGIYKKTKIFTTDNPHPDGTIFTDSKDGEYYYIEKGTRRPVIGPNISNFYLRNNPILADKGGLETKSSCVFKKSLGIFRKYRCQLPLDNINSFIGNDYQFQMEINPDIRAKTLTVNLKKNITWNNLKLAISNIILRIMAQYGAGE
jgi:hypothetical protein